MTDADLIQHAVLCQLNKRTLTPEQADRLIELARLGSSVVGAQRMSIKDAYEETEDVEGTFCLVLAGEGDK